MPALVWDKIGEKVFETGVSKGVIYMDDGRAVPWNGLVSVTESNSRSTTSVYYDGAKVNTLVSPGDFSGTIAAITYPDELQELDGMARVGAGIYFADQQPKMFNLTYQTLVGNDVAGLDAGYKIHVLYNVTAIPSDRSYQTISGDVSLDPFEWSITTVPQEVPGKMPTSRFIFDSREVPADFLADLELMFYGKDFLEPRFPEFDDLISLLVNNYAVDITDLKDGRWTAESPYANYILSTGPDEFQINNVEGSYSDADTYTISDTLT